jgi:23S rRNA pseudouridine1911/1915/1917 synthase
MRIDKHLVDSGLAMSRGEAVHMINTGLVSLRGVVTTKGSTKFNYDDEVEVRQADPTDMILFKPEVLFENDEYLVVNKPIGMLTHAKGGYLKEQTLASWFAERQGWSDELVEGHNARRGIVHRLDRTTSGVIALAKNDESEKHLSKQFADRRVVKEYVAVTTSKPELDEAIIDVPIARNANKPHSFKDDSSGKPAQTHYKVLEELKVEGKSGYLVQLMPKTGRTHQLRVHLAHVGAPILGDTLYGGKKAERVYLHSTKLEFRTQSGETISVVCGVKF